MTTEVVSELVREVDKLREHGERVHDDLVVGTSQRALALLSRLRQPVISPGLISIGEAIQISGKSRNTIKGWVGRSLLDGYKSRTSRELFVRRDQLLTLLDVAPVRPNTPSTRQELDPAANTRGNRHRLVELRSLALHRRIAEMIEEDPLTIERARHRVRRWMDGSEYFTGSRSYASRWSELLSGPRQQLLDVLTSDDEDSRALRQSSPFAGFLSELERKRIMDAVVE
jgi:hypothetical protein